MHPAIQRPNRGLDLRGGKRLLNGFMRACRNSRYLPGDNRGRLWALLGRARWNVGAFPAPAGAPATDDAVVKTIHPYYVEGGTSKLWVHKGGSIYEGDLGVTGTPSEAFVISSGAATPRGNPVPYFASVYYPIGADAWSTSRHFLVRDETGWKLGGFRTPTATFGAAASSSPGTVGSTYPVRYTYRIYDANIGNESAHGPVVEVAAFAAKLLVRLTFNAPGVTLAGERGTHVRIYRTLLDEPASVYWRVDGAGDGIPIADVIGGYIFDDTTSNTTAQIQGTVPADGLEGTDLWAEYGGPPPQARGGVVFQDHLVLYGIPGREIDIIASAQGRLECFPVDFEGVYQYYMPMTTSKQDSVQSAIVVGAYLIVGTKNSVLRVTHIPTYAFAGFDRVVQSELSDQHGFAGPYAAAAFGLGGEDDTSEPKYAVYVSREHGPHLTNGATTRPLVQQGDWLNLIERSLIQNVVVRNYPTMQEVWVFYTPAGGTRNTQAMILDYSGLVNAGETGFAPTVRLSGPIDVQGDDAVLAWGNDGIARFYIVASNGDRIYVQDQGDVDEQHNTNEDGDIVVEWELGRLSPRGHNRYTRFTRAMLEGSSGVEREFEVRSFLQNGVDDQMEFNTVGIGPGSDTVDAYLVNGSGQACRARFTYTGPTGTTYDEADAGCAPCLASLEYEVDSGGRAGRTRDVMVGDVLQ